MPMSQSFKNRLFPVVDKIAAHYGTPFHIYDEAGIRETGAELKQAFAGIAGFQEFYAVKALPNLQILKLMKEMGFGFDCSSIPELILARELGARGEQIMFTSNNTSAEEFAVAAGEGGCILNLDDISLIDKVPAPFPELVCFRYNPGPRRTGNIIIGNPVEAKYGVTHEQVVEAYRRGAGARRQALRPAHHGRLQRARLYLHGGDRAHGPGDRREGRGRPRHPLRVRQYRRRLRHPLPPRGQRPRHADHGGEITALFNAFAKSTATCRRCTWRAAAT